ncbi:MAG: efflux RND transporter periplasmic adaptor subunit, partial [Candidatus Latescibacteria bacterium]|nr:efflux RND transporter periplasmic adaptor subunit [Candidatus Latescibacterota bacterium]
MKKIIGILVIVSLFGVGIHYFRAGNGAKEEGPYQFAEITRGDLENLVSSTGTLKAVSTVEIGTQVSGTIDRIDVDFNDAVRKGQVLAVLDTALLKVAVLDAQAGVARAQAQHEQARAEYERNRALFEKGHLSEKEFLPIRINVRITGAAVQSAKASLERAQINMNHATIRSPIHGTVIQRNVEPGQTVAASFSTPTLFIIAEDLSQMEIYAAVDESDIGQIKEGQSVRFEVQAYLDETFSGTVRQIRLQPAISENVVNYTVVVDAANEENLLLPGMTATVDFVVEARKAVLLIPN